MTRITLVRGASAFALLCAAAPAFAQEPTTRVDELIVTATARPEARTRIVSTVQVIDQQRIERSTAQSVTDLMAENAGAFLSTWTSGQTSVNIRGGASDGQGRDFRGQILVLVNGRRAGTANLSKLSSNDVARVEIVRGPASVVYGSQNIGGVVNLITKTGRTNPGTVLQATVGSWDLRQGYAQTGGFGETVDWYLGVSAGERGSYDAGDGGPTQVNSDWTRKGATAAFGWRFAPEHRLDATFRTDGVYDVGFRGSGGNIHSRENRFNTSGDLSYSGQTRDGRLSWLASLYAVQDVDNFRWASPVVRSGNNPAPGTAKDWNRRQLDIWGLKVQPRIGLWTGNNLLLGWDYETSVLRSDRYREALPGQAALAQVAPLDNNQTDKVNAFYFEDSQSLLDDRLTLRGGLRHTRGETSFDPTPHVAAQRARTAEYDNTTYSAGATLRATDNIVLRAGASTGFRTPTGSELAADFTALGGGRIFGNPNLKPESSRQIEIGALVSGGTWRFDVATFENIISDRIINRARPGVANTSDYINNPADIVLRGVELQGDVDLLTAPGSAWGLNLFGSASYHFDMEDKGAAATANTRKAQRVYEYQGVVGARFASTIGERRWSAEAAGVLRGPVYYDTEESLLVPQAEPFREFIHRKSPFWVFNARADVELSKTLTLFGAVNNLLDKNEHPLLMAVDKGPSPLADLRFYNGGTGTSMPGREFLVGLRAKF